MPHDLWCVLVQKLHDDAVIPSRGTPGSAGFDFSAYLQGGNKSCIHIAPGGKAIIPTGVAIAIMDANWELQVRSRSGLGAKGGLVVRQGVATRDSDFRGEVQICMWNTTQHDHMIRHGQRFCQGVFCPVWIGELQICEALPPSSRGKRGWGSTGR